MLASDVSCKVSHRDLWWVKKSKSLWKQRAASWKRWWWLDLNSLSWSLKWTWDEVKHQSFSLITFLLIDSIVQLHKEICFIFHWMSFFPWLCWWPAPHLQSLFYRQPNPVHVKRKAQIFWLHKAYVDIQALIVHSMCTYEEKNIARIANAVLCHS